MVLLAHSQTQGGKMYNSYDFGPESGPDIIRRAASQQPGFVAKHPLAFVMIVMSLISGGSGWLMWATGHYPTGSDQVYRGAELGVAVVWLGIFALCWGAARPGRLQRVLLILVTLSALLVAIAVARFYMAGS